MSTTNKGGRPRGPVKQRLRAYMKHSNVAQLQRAAAQHMLPLGSFIEDHLMPAYFELEETQRIQGLEIEALKEQLRINARDIMKLQKENALLQTKLTMPRRSWDGLSASGVLG